MRDRNQGGDTGVVMALPGGATAGTESVAGVAFEEEARPHFQALYRAALRLTHEVEAAEDLVQDTLERAYRKFDRYEPGTNIRAWLLRIMRNQWISSYRRQAGAPALTSLDTIEESSLYHRSAGDDLRSSEVEGYVIDRLSEASILATIETLPPRFREAVVLADVEGAAVRAIAETLEVPLGTVLSRLFRGRQRLKDALREQYRSPVALARAG